MRYDIDTGKILITLGELVLIARRGISATLPVDEDEPNICRPSLMIRRAALGDKEPIPVRFGFDALGYSFELIGEADMIEGEEVTVLFSTDTNASSPKSEEIRQARGMGFILSYMYASIEGYDNISLNIIYFNENSGEYDTRVEKTDISTLKKFFDKCVGEVVKFARPEIDRVTERLPSLRSLKFPHKRVREGQDEFVRAAYRALSRGTTLYASSPTGTGKTVSAIYPALKLVGEGKEDKVFYLTPKTTTAVSAKDCVESFAKGGAKIRGIVLTSKERSCKQRLICKRNIRFCPLSNMNKLAEATLALYDLGITVVTIDDIHSIATKYSVCPYELELSYAELCDIVICDINYLFDPRAYIRRFFNTGGRFALLIDEAHNLVERSREMYSAELLTSDITLPLAEPYTEASPMLLEALPDIRSRFISALYPYLKDEVREDKNGDPVAAVHLSYIPNELYSLFLELVTIYEGALKASYKLRDELSDLRCERYRELYYSAKALLDRASAFGGGYRLFLFLSGEDIRIKLFCVDSGDVIRDIIAKGRGAVFFSATLSPIDYYRAVLGGDNTSEVLETRSPFVPEALSVSIIDKISTRYSERERTLPMVSRTIAATISARRGNYMVFLPSFEYLEALSRDFSAKYPSLRVLSQKRNMTDKEKADFLAAFEEDNPSYLIGFCVMGGIYSEGVDLVGKSLIGAIVVGIGMPQLSYERECLAEYYDDKFDAGKLYAYIYPGMNRVLQAAGRVIRSENDRGVIVLIDDRFADPIYKKTVPDLWRGMEYVPDAKSLNERIKKFWADIDSEI